MTFWLLLRQSGREHDEIKDNQVQNAVQKAAGLAIYQVKVVNCNSVIGQKSLSPMTNKEAAD